MRVCSLASGSSGNCIYVNSGGSHILVDAGISRKRIVAGLETIGVAPEKISGIFVTHEHSDHIQGLYMMVKQFGIPIFATGGTLDKIRSKDKKRLIGMENLYEVHADEGISHGEFEIMPFHISHDAADPVCYTIKAGGHKASIATDLGVFDDYTVKHLEGSEVLLLEANHDISMLEAGAYPYKLKCRILSEHGHLSNEDSGRLLCRLMGKSLKYAVLAHLSKENNYPDLAFQSVKCQIWEEMGMRELPFALSVANRDEPSPIVTLG